MIGVGWVVTLDDRTATVVSIKRGRVTLDDGRHVDIDSLNVAS